MRISHANTRLDRKNHLCYNTFSFITILPPGSVMRQHPYAHRQVTGFACKAQKMCVRVFYFLCGGFYEAAKSVSGADKI